MTTTDKQRTCADRLQAHLDSRLEDFRAILGRDDPHEPDDDNGPIGEYPLGVSIRYAIRVELSTGGPADYIEYVVSDGMVITATYHFADWFDHAEQTLTGDDFTDAASFLEALYGDLSEIGEYVS